MSADYRFAVEPAAVCFADPANTAYWIDVTAAAEAAGCGFDAPTALYNARDGKYLLFTVRANGALVGSCGVYLRGRWAQEDILYLAPQHRRPGLARGFLAFGEDVLHRHTPAVEFRCLVAPGAMVRFMAQAGYQTTAVQMVKKVAR